MQLQGEIRWEHSIFLFSFKKKRKAKFLTSLLFFSWEVLRYLHQLSPLLNIILMCRPSSVDLGIICWIKHTRAHTRRRTYTLLSYFSLISSWCGKLPIWFTKAETQLLAASAHQNSCRALGWSCHLVINVLGPERLCLLFAENHYRDLHVCFSALVCRCKERHLHSRNFFCVRWLFLKLFIAIDIN